MTILRFLSLPVLLMMLLVMPAAAETLPAPVNGVTFEEWASANGRLANKQNEAQVLAVLGLNKQSFEAVNVAFTEAMKKSQSNGDIMRVFGEAFGDPNRGRFAKTEQVDIEGKLATLDDYARVQGHLQAATKLKIDPATVLEEHNLTPYEYSQEAGRWVRAMAMEARKDASNTLKYRDAIDRYEQEYLAKLSKK